MPLKLPTPLKMTMKTPKQHQSRSCAFIVGFEQILYIDFHAYLTYFRNSLLKTYL